MGIQKFVIETSQQAFLHMVDVSLKDGFQLIAGSNYIKSLPTHIGITSGRVLNDIDHVFSVGLRNVLDTMIFSGNLDLFRDSVNRHLKDNCVIVGSLFIDVVLKDGYERHRRIYTTYYSCFLHKD